MCIVLMCYLNKDKRREGTITRANARVILQYRTFARSNLSASISKDIQWKETRSLIVHSRFISLNFYNLRGSQFIVNNTMEAER